MSEKEPKVKYTAEHVLGWLSGAFREPSYVVLPGVREGTGWEAERRADAIVVSLWPSSGQEIQGFEIKVSRSDWLRELKDPWKSEAVAQFCDRWWLLIPDPSIVKPNEVPEGWGVMLLDGRKVKKIVDAPKRIVKPITRGFLASLLQVSMTRRAPEPKIIDGRSPEYAVERMDEAVRNSLAALVSARKKVNTALNALNNAEWYGKDYELTIKRRNLVTGEVVEEKLDV